MLSRVFAMLSDLLQCLVTSGPADRFDDNLAAEVDDCVWQGRLLGLLIPFRPTPSHLLGAQSNSKPRMRPA